MLDSTPTHCRPRAYELFASQVAIIQSSDALLTAAVAIAMHEMVDADAHAVDMKLQALVDRVRARVRDTNAPDLLMHVHEVLFEQELFRGNTQNYYDPMNSYLPAVLETKRGIPITLALLYKLVAERLGVRVHGINTPYHFLVGVDLPEQGQRMYVDCFGGGTILSRDEVFDQLEKLTGRTVLRSSELLAEATHRQWLGRMLQNLQAIFVQQGRQTDLSAMFELRALLEAS